MIIVQFHLSLQVLNHHVYELLETRGKLRKLVLTRQDCSTKSNELESFVFVSEDVFTNEDKVCE